MSVVSGHSQKTRLGAPLVGTVTTCEIAASPSGSLVPATEPRSTAVLPLCGLAPSATGGGTVASMLQPASPSFSKPPLVRTSRGAEQDAVRKLKQAEVAAPPQAFAAVTCHEYDWKAVSASAVGTVSVVAAVSYVWIA